MNDEIDLSKYKIRTDLAIEEIERLKPELTGIISEQEQIKDIKITRVTVEEEGSKKIGKNPGEYITIEFKDITDYENKENLKKIFSNELKELLKKINIKQTDTCLIVGLGNRKSTPDSLGPVTVDSILVTKHLFDLDKKNVNRGFRPVSAFTPGVMGETGIETSEIILGIIERIKPDFIIAIDALASQSINRVNRTIQMTDTGIHPGSGVGNARKELNKNTIGIPVIALGVPTVVDAVTIVGDTIDYIVKHFSYKTQNINNPVSKLAPLINIENENIVELSKDQKEKLMGIIGGLEENDLKQLIFEILTPMGYNLMVTPKEVDFIMEKLVDIISGGINNTLHRQVTKS
ncbi:MAG: GPR endopeptidase [Bacilli bacterium]